MTKRSIIKIYIYVLIFLTFSTTTYSHCKIGYGSSDAVYSAKNQEYFYTGFLFGFEKIIDKEKYRKISELIESVRLQDQKKLSPKRSALKLVKQNICVLTGFPTSHEALLVSSIAKKNNLLLFSAAAAHSQISTMGEHIYTLGESANKLKDALINYINTNYKNSKGLLLYNPKNVFSLNQLKMLQKSNLKFDKVIVDKDLRISSSTLLEIRNKKYSYIIVTLYADNSTAFLEQLIQNNINIPLITNSSWIIGNIELVRRLLKTYLADVVVFASVFKKMKTAQSFEKNFILENGKMPEPEVYYGHDLGVIIGTVLNRIPKNELVNSQSFKKYFNQDLCFTGTSTGKTCFPKKGGHAIRTIYQLKFDSKSGFEPIKNKRF